MSKHTPGPWAVMPPLGPGDMAVQSAHVNAGGNFYVAVLPNSPHEESDANAHLIAAAPDLLAACKGLTKHVGELGRLTRAIDLTIHPNARNLVAALTAVIRLAELVPVDAAIAKAEGGAA